jgi:hypothetical protein
LISGRNPLRGSAYGKKKKIKNQGTTGSEKNKKTKTFLLRQKDY